MPPTLLSTTRTEDETQDLSVEDLWFAFRATGSREDRDRLVLHYTGLVTYVAARVGAPMPSSVDYSDLIQSGVIGLMDAVARFEPERGLKFETYAVTRIRGAILDGLREQDWVPRSVRKKARDLDAATESCRTRLGRTPTAAELAEELNVTADDSRRHPRPRQPHAGQRAREHHVPRARRGETCPIADTFADPLAEQPGDALEQASRSGRALWRRWTPWVSGTAQSWCTRTSTG